MSRIIRAPIVGVRAILRSRHRILWIAVLLLLAATASVGGIACYIVSDLTYPGEQTAKVMLPDTDGYLNFNLKPGLTQSLNFKSFLDSFSDTPSVSEDWQNFLQQIETDWGINVEDEVQPWSGPELAFGTVHGADAATSGPQMFFYIGTSDEEATEAVLQKWLQGRVLREGIALGNDTYRGEQITIVNSPEPAEFYTVTQGYGMGFFGNVTRLERTIDLMQDGGPSLWDNANFQSARAHLPGERMGMGYFDSHHFLGAVVEPSIEDAIGWTLYDTFTPYAPPFIGLSVSFYDEGIKIHVWGPTPEGFDFAMQDPHALRAADFVPGTCLAFWTDQNPGIWWLETLAKRAQLALDPELNTWLEQNFNPDAVEQELGIDFEEDVLAWMTGEVAAACLPYYWQGGPPGPDYLALFQIDDHQLVEEKIQTIIDALGNSTGAVITQEPVTINSVDATLIYVEGLWADELPFLGYLFLDDFLIVGSSEQALSESIEAYQSPPSSLSESPEFQNMLSMLPAEKAGLIYANGGYSTDFVLTHLITTLADREEYYRDFARFVEPAMSAGFYYHIGANDTTATIAFHVTHIELPLTAVSINAPGGVYEGINFRATVDLCQVDNFHSADYDIHFDPAVVEVTDVTAGVIGSTEIPIDMWAVITPGTIRVVQNVPGPEGISGHGHVATLHFQVVGSVGDISNMTISNGLLLDDQASEIPADWLGASLRVVEIGGSISGHVYQEDGVTPIPNLHVNAEDYDTGVGMDGTNTNIDGAYSMLLPAGTYRVRACSSCSGLPYLDEFYDDTYNYDDATPVSVTVPDDTPNIDFTLGVGGTISGHVYQHDGSTPIPDLHVYACDYDTNVWMDGINTDQDGAYSLVLPSGTYRVRACASCSGLPYLDEFYDDTYNYDDATPVSVTAPNETPDIDFILEVGGSISGHVYEVDGVTPIPNCHVHAEILDSGYSRGTQSDSNGSYSIIGLPSGEYKVNAGCDPYAREFWEETAYETEADTVSVTAPDDTPNIDFTLEVGGTISGHVYQHDGSTPIPNLHIQVWDYDTGIGMGGTNTDQDGNYTLVVPSGEYRVRACSSCSGLPYIDEFYDDTYNYGDATPVSVTAPNETPDIDFTLEVGGTISGHVYQHDGSTPIPDLHVQAFDYDTNVWMAGTNTNEDGSYSLLLPSGTYRVRACASCDGLPYLDEFYDDTYNYDDATPVPVTTPDDTPNINFNLEIDGSISGLVRNAAENPIAGTWVYVWDYDSDAGFGRSQTAGDGSYTIPNLPSGTYRVRVSSYWPYVGEYYDNTYNHDEATPVSVTAPSDTPNIDFILEVGGTISGHVYEEDGTTPIPNLHIQVWDYDTGIGMGGTNTNQDGSYTLVVPSGEYRVRACASCDGLPYVDEFYDNAYGHHNAAPVPVTAPNETPDIDFTLEVGGTISGHVYQDDGVTPIPNLHVNAEDYETGVGMGGTNTDQDGAYSILLPSGEYRVGASSYWPYVGEYYDNTYNYGDATPVPVTVPNDTPDIDFILEVGGTISGHVYQDDGVTPIPNLHVNAEDYDTGVWMDGTNTNQDGSYTLVVPSGEYRVRACASCDGLPYVDEFYDNAYGHHNAAPVPVTAPSDTPDIDFTLEVGGTISGHVYQHDGSTPIPNLHVYATDYHTDVWVAGTNTDQDGSYSLLLPSGTYRVRACASCDGLPYLDEFYDDTYNYGDATPVPVTVSNDTPGIDFTLAVTTLITTNPATNVTPTSVTLNGTLDNLGSALYMDIYFVIGLTSHYTYPVYIDRLFTAPDSFSYDIPSGLTPGTTYHYAAASVDNYGTVVYGNDVTFSYILPTVTTDAATNVTPTSATLNGTLDNLGSASYVDIYFVVGLTSSYTDYVYVDRLFAAPDSFSYDIPSGLTPGTTYHYAAASVDNYGTVVYGNDVTFTYILPTVTTDDATDVTPTSATLNGTLDTGSASYVDVYFVIGLTSSYTHYVYVDKFTAPDSFSYDIPSGLTPGTTYHYAAASVDNYGVLVYGNDVTFTTGGP